MGKTSKEIRKELAELRQQHHRDMEKAREDHMAKVAALRSQLKDAVDAGR